MFARENFLSMNKLNLQELIIMFYFIFCPLFTFETKFAFKNINTCISGINC